MGHLRKPTQIALTIDEVRAFLTVVGYWVSVFALPPLEGGGNDVRHSFDTATLNRTLSPSMATVTIQIFINISAEFVAIGTFVFHLDTLP